jgi:hypothetical protein
MVAYLQRRVVESSGIVRSITGFTTFVSRLCTGLCTSCGNHVSYGLFSCAWFMEQVRQRIHEDVRGYLIVLAESNIDDEEVLDYVRNRLAAAYEFDMSIEEDLRAYWWSVILGCLLPFFPGEFRGSLKFLELGYDVARLVVVTNGGPLPPKTSRSALRRSWTRHRNEPSMFVRWLLSVLNVPRESEWPHLPKSTDSLVRLVRLASALYKFKYSDVLVYLVLALAGKDWIDQHCFRGGLWFITDPTNTDSLSWGDWRREEIGRSLAVSCWLREAVRVMTPGSVVRTDRVFMAVVARLTGRANLVPCVVSYGESHPPGNVGEAIFAARRPCRDVVRVDTYVPLARSLARASGEKVVGLVGEGTSSIGCWRPYSLANSWWPTRVVRPPPTPLGYRGSLQVPLLVEKLGKIVTYRNAIGQIVRGIQSKVYLEDIDRSWRELSVRFPRNVTLKWLNEGVTPLRANLRVWRRENYVEVVRTEQSIYFGSTPVPRFLRDLRNFASNFPGFPPPPGDYETRVVTDILDELYRPGRKTIETYSNSSWVLQLNP